MAFFPLVLSTDPLLALKMRQKRWYFYNGVKSEHKPSWNKCHVMMHMWDYTDGISEEKRPEFNSFRVKRNSWATTFSLHSNSLSLKLENCLVLISSHDYPKKMISQKVLWQSVLFLKWALRKNSLDHNHWRGINRIFRLWIVIKDQPRVHCCWDYGSVATGSSARGSKKKRKTAQ